MSKLLVIFFLLQNLLIYSQKSPYDIQFSYQLESQIAEEQISTTRAGLLYSLIGDYYNSTYYSDQPIHWGLDSVSLEKYNWTAALPKVIEAAKGHQIVIISENHLKPQHRIFAKQIINELSDAGFSHLGLETLAHSEITNQLRDIDLMTRGYPLNTPLTGTYTLESQMANLVRDAIKNDYSLFAYERQRKIKGIDREEIQADNIITYLKSHPNEKVIILCGFHHAIESDLLKYNNAFFMAKYLKDKTGIDPLTIYQDNFTEKTKENEHPILQNNIFKIPSLIVDKNDNPIQLTDNIDLEIIHPKTYYQNGRPNWLYQDKNYKAININLDRKTTKFPVIVSAFPFNEKNSVPFDRIELKHKYDFKNLVLKTGHYLIQIFDGKETAEYNIIVE